MGLKEDMMKELEKIEHDKNKGPKEERKIDNKCTYILNIFSNIIFLLFFGFTIISLMSMQPTDETFALHHSIQTKFGSPNNGYLDQFLLREDIRSRLKDLFLEPKLKRTPMSETTSQVSPIRISFYNTLATPCSGPFANSTDASCFFPLYDLITANRRPSNPKMTNGNCKKEI